MITIITGIPGMGKSALIVSMMLKEQQKGWEGGERPFFVMGIPDLALDHAKCPPVIDWTEKRPDPDDPTLLLDYFTFPPNSIVVIDEAQRVFRNRAAASKVPSHVAAFETHRHTGVDFWLLTQKPHLLDPNIRELCGRHIHIKPTLLGRYLYEWPEFADPKSRSDRDLAAKRKFSPPKTAFKQYKSAELHTKQPFRMHNIYLIAPFALGLFGYFMYDAVSLLLNKTEPLRNPEAQTAASQTALPITLETPIKTVTDSLTPTTGIVPATLPSPTPAAIGQPIHPFIGYTFYLRGTIKGKGEELTYFDVTSPDGQTTFINSKELKEIGYSIRLANECAAFLFFEGAQVVATCERPINVALQRNDSRSITSGDGVEPHVDFNAPL